MTFGPSFFFKTLTLLIYSLLTSFLYSMYSSTQIFFLNIEKITTQRFIVAEAFVLISIFLLGLIFRTIAVTPDSFTISSFGFEKKIKKREIKGYLILNSWIFLHDFSSSFYLVDHQDRVLWSFSKPFGIKVFFRELDLLEEIEKFPCLNDGQISYPFKLKFSKLFTVSMLFLFSLPFQLMLIEIFI